MAEAQAAKPAGNSKASELAKVRSKKFITNLIMVVAVTTIVGVALSSVGMPVAFSFVAIGMLPCITANITDNRPGRFASKTVTAFNLAGIFPHLVAIFTSGSPNNTALSLLQNPNSWLLVYGLAAIGWVIVFLIPHIVHIYLDIKSVYIINKLESFQEALVEEWGEEIKKG